MIDAIRATLQKHHTPQLVDELIEAYNEAKQNYYEGGHRLSAVEGGRFCEAAYRILEEATQGHFTPLGGQLDTERLLRRLASLSSSAHTRSIRLHIPRALRVVYDIRNNRDAAHLADGIDPNIQDANLVIAILSWVFAELIRIYHDVTADEAQEIVDSISIRRAPVIQEFSDFPRVLRSDLRAGDFVLLLLYHADFKGATYPQLSSWVRPSMVKHLRRTLETLDDKAYVHYADSRYVITIPGKRYVEDRRLLQPLAC